MLFKGGKKWWQLLLWKGLLTKSANKTKLSWGWCAKECGISVTMWSLVCLLFFSYLNVLSDIFYSSLLSVRLFHSYLSVILCSTVISFPFPTPFTFFNIFTQYWFPSSCYPFALTLFSAHVIILAHYPSLYPLGNAIPFYIIGFPHLSVYIYQIRIN